MSVDRADVERIAELAKLRLEDAEAERLTSEMSRILEHAERLRGLDLGGSEGEAGPPPQAGSGTRDPEAEHADALKRPPGSFAPDMREGFFVVPPPPGVEPDAGGQGGDDDPGRGDALDPDAGGGRRSSGRWERAWRVGPMSTTLRDHVARIREVEDGPDGINAFLCFAGAEESVVERQGGPGPLAGVPVAVKDNLATADMPTTCGSRILQGYTSPYEATVVRKLRAAGALIVGKTNLDEFAMGSSTENSAFGATLNPRDRTRVPGGSSGGSAAAVAAGYVPMAIGSDTGGSVRQPAAFCGVVGIKPTYGRVSRYGLVAFASSLDQVGTFGRTVEEAAGLLEIVSGHDPRDATSVDLPVPPFSGADGEALAGTVIGVPREYFPESLNGAVRARSVAVLEGLESAGATVRDVTLPSTDLAIPCYYVLAPAEASSNLARYDGVRYGARHAADDIDTMYAETRARGFGHEVKRRIMVGTYALSAGYYDEYYGAAQRARDRIRRDLERVFADGIDVLFTPTTPGPAFRLGERIDDPLRMYLSDVFTVTANLAGVPAISVPIGTVDGLPIGGQVIAPWWHEEPMITVAGAIERFVGEL